MLKIYFFIVNCPKLKLMTIAGKIGKIITGILIIIGILATLVTAPRILSFFGVTGLENVTASAFLPVVIASTIIIIGIIIYHSFGSLAIRSIAKGLINFGYIVYFIAFFIVEVGLITDYMRLNPEFNVDMNSCKTPKNIFDNINCFLVGYTAKEKLNLYSGSVFIFVFILLPALFLFFFIYSMIFGPIESFFSGSAIPKEVVAIILSLLMTFITIRQAIGYYIFTMYAYGIWGVIGIFIPLLIVNAIKKVINSILIYPAELVAQETRLMAESKVEGRIKEIENLTQTILEKITSGNIENKNELVAYIDRLLKNIEMVRPLASEAGKKVLTNLEQSLNKAKQSLRS